MSDLAQSSLLYSARPAIAVDGVDDEELAQGLLSIAVEEDIEGLFRCEATFGNWGTGEGSVDFLYFDGRVLDFGRSLRVTVGSGDRQGRIFEGRISAIEGRFPQARPPEVLVLAEDRFQDLRKKRRTRSFEDSTFADLAQQIASDHGLRADIDADGPAYPVLAQVNQSDLAFLRERARAVDAELWMDGDTLHAQARSRRNSDEVTLTYGQSMREAMITADIANQTTALTISGWDVAAKEALSEEAGDGALGAESEGKTGAQVLQQAFGERPERVVHTAPITADEARVLAESYFRRAARGFVRGQAVAEGDARIRAGSKVTLRGVGQVFDGSYYVTQARHAFDLIFGFQTHFSFERAWIPA
jgi:phage protein D